VEYIYAIIIGRRFYVTRGDDDSIIYNYMLSHEERRLPLVMKGPDSPIKRRAEGHEEIPT